MSTVELCCFSLYSAARHANNPDSDPRPPRHRAQRGSPVATEVTTKTGEAGDVHHAVLWAKNCDGRMEYPTTKETEPYMIIRDCGKTVIAVSPAEKAAVKIGTMESSPATDIQTSAAFMQGTPSIQVDKLAERPGETVLGRATRYFQFKSIYKPDPAVTRDRIVMNVDEEFWVDPSLDAPALDSFLGKAPAGVRNGPIRAAYAVMKGLPLRSKRTVIVERDGQPGKPSQFFSDVVKISLEPFSDSVFQWPKDYQYADISGQSE